MNIGEGSRVRDTVTRARGYVRRMTGHNGHSYAVVDFDDGSTDILRVTELVALQDAR